MDNNSFKTQSEEILTLSEAAGYLKIAEKTLLRMIHRKEVPAAKVGNQYRFLRSVLEDWLISKMKVLPSNDVSRLIEEQGELLAVWRLLDEKMVLPDLPAAPKEEILRQLTAPLAEAGMLNSVESYTAKLIAREEMASTAIESGAALPHLRKPEENPPGKPVIVLGRCREGIDFGAPDGGKTKLFFLLCTDSEVIHLRVLSLLARIMKIPGLLSSLLQADTAGEIISLIHAAETRVAGGTK